MSTSPLLRVHPFHDTTRTFHRILLQGYTECWSEEKRAEQTLTDECWWHMSSTPAAAAASAEPLLDTEGTKGRMEEDNGALHVHMSSV